MTLPTTHDITRELQHNINPTIGWIRLHHDTNPTLPVDYTQLSARLDTAIEAILHMSDTDSKKLRKEIQKDLTEIFTTAIEEILECDDQGIAYKNILDDAFTRATMRTESILALSA